jgi:hypothetical protein
MKDEFFHTHKEMGGKKIVTRNYPQSSLRTKHTGSMRGNGRLGGALDSVSTKRKAGMGQTHRKMDLNHDRGYSSSEEDKDNNGKDDGDDDSDDDDDDDDEREDKRDNGDDVHVSNEECETQRMGGIEHLQGIGEGQGTGTVREGAFRVVVDSSVSGSSRTGGESTDVDKETRENMLVTGIIPIVFKATKFFGCSKDIGHESKIARLFCQRLDVPLSSRHEWWDRKQNDIRKKLDSKRSSVTNAIKHEYMSKYDNEVMSVKKI